MFRHISIPPAIPLQHSYFQLVVKSPSAPKYAWLASSWPAHPKAPAVQTVPALLPRVVPDMPERGARVAPNLAC
jgi:hypothetical protein